MARPRETRVVWTGMDVGAAKGQVALLIDFENLVRAVDEEDIDCAAVFRLAD